MTMIPDYGYNPNEAIAAAASGVAGFLMVFLVLFYLLMFAWAILNYVLYSLSIYKIAQRRGIYHPWLAWLPIGNVWVLGSISDQYQYLAKDRVKNRRKVLTGLSIGLFALMFVMIIAAVVMGFSEAAGADASETVFGAMLAVIILAYVAMLVLAIVTAVFQYMALYDLFVSCEPSNAVLYLVLSILIGVVLPFFLFACRNKDLGMPPRKVVRSAYIPEPYVPEEPQPCEQANPEPPVQTEE